MSTVTGYEPPEVCPNCGDAEWDDEEISTLIAFDSYSNAGTFEWNDAIDLTYGYCCEKCSKWYIDQDAISKIVAYFNGLLAMNN